MKNTDGSLDATSIYLQNVSKQKRITYAQEIELAKEIERLEIEYWKALLSYSSFDSIARIIKKNTNEPRITEQLNKLNKLQLFNSIDIRNDCIFRLAVALREADKNRMIVRKVYQHVRLLSDSGKEETKSYLSRVEKARTAQQEVKHRFVTANLRLVIGIAKRYKTQSLIDLIQEGNIGLMKAVERFDYRKEVTFMSYAIWWIRAYINRYIDDRSRMVRVPVHVSADVRKIIRTKETFESRNGRIPTVEEIANETNISSNVIKNTETDIIKDALSLDIAVSGENEPLWLDYLADESVNDTVAQRLDRNMIDNLLGSLSDRKKQIVSLRFGLDGDEGKSLEGVGRALGVTRQAIEDAEKRILSKLRRGVAGLNNSI